MLQNRFCSMDNSTDFFNHLRCHSLLINQIFHLPPNCRYCPYHAHNNAYFFRPIPLIPRINRISLLFPPSQEPTTFGMCRRNNIHYYNWASRLLHTCCFLSWNSFMFFCRIPLSARFSVSTMWLIMLCGCGIYTFCYLVLLITMF